MKKLGQNIYLRIKQVCTQRHMTLAEFCRKTGLSVNSLQNWNRGITPPLERLLTLASQLDVSPAWLAFGVEGGPVTDTEGALLDEYRRLNVRQRDALLQFCQAFAHDQPGPRRGRYRPDPRLSEPREPPSLAADAPAEYGVASED
jgi:transcriptional regulator with XRE-family HTH domain